MIVLQVPAPVIDADHIVRIVSDWIKSEPSMTVNGIVLDVDPNCPAMLHSFDSNDCVSEVTPGETNSSVSSSQSSSVGIIVGTIVAAVMTLILLLITAVVIVAYYKSKQNYRYKSHHINLACYLTGV